MGGHQALDDVSLTVGAGETVTILGANGAGKTTLMNTVAGLLRPKAQSRIAFPDARHHQRHATQDRRARHILVPEGRRVFGALSVKENLKLGAFARRAQRNHDANLKTVLALFPRLAERRNQIARTLSGGEQQMLAIARALMSDPKLLLLDEPSLGLSPILCKELFSTIQTIGSTDVSVLLVEQNARRSLKIAQRAIYLLENGRIVGHGTADRTVLSEATSAWRPVTTGPRDEAALAEAAAAGERDTRTKSAYSARPTSANFGMMSLHSMPTEARQPCQSSI